MYKRRPQLTCSSRNRTDKKVDFEKLEDRNLLAADFVSSLSYAREHLWRAVPDIAVQDAGDRIHVQATDTRLFDIHETLLLKTLLQAPLEFTDAADQPLVMTLPAPDGSFQQFEIVEAPIIEDQLARRFQDIKTFRGIGVDDPTAALRMDITSHGFHAQVISTQGTWMVDPYFHLETEFYASYHSSEAIQQATNQRYQEIGVVGKNGELLNDHNDPDASSDPVKGEDNAPWSRSSLLGGGLDLRVYETVVAATGEYTQFHGGTVGDAMAEIVTAINRVNQVYERDIAARMILVANNDSVIYTDGVTDPYTNDNGFAMLAENQANLDAVIGDANYDLGHVFSTGGGGVAGLGVIGVSGQKARGVTGLPSPVGDPFYIDYVAHEIGHQYGGRHTFNGDSGSCATNRSAQAAYEPGSGSTIQAYAGICGNDNLQSNSDDMFHWKSIEEMRGTITSGAGNAAATIVPTINSQPTANAGPNYVIPAMTPFSLKGEGSDPDSSDVLTYSWEQRDLGPQQDVNAGDNGSSPLWRTWLPTEDPVRTFPRLPDLLNNTTVVGETLPTTDRPMRFRLVVRDNSPEPAGGVAVDDLEVVVVDTGMAFEITSQNAATTWTGTETETITWNVADTDGLEIGAQVVDILYSMDGGNRFDTLLAAAVPNDGSHDIVVPNVPTTSARIMVQATGNIFFDINNVNIEVLEGGPSVDITESDGGTLISEDGALDSYQIALGTDPDGVVDLTVFADSQSEVSTNGVVYLPQVTITKTNTLPSTIFVRAIDDATIEGDHISRIAHRITDSTDLEYTTSLPIISVVADVEDNEHFVGEFLVGVDFGPFNDTSPVNWTQVGASGSTVTLNNLLFEDGTSSPYDITIEELVDGNWNSDDPNINANTIPQHPNSLDDLDGQIWTNSDPLQVTWSDLDQNLDYEVYVFGLEGFYDDIAQQVTISGEGTPVSFTQAYLKNDLFINDQKGSSLSNLSEFAVVVPPDANGQIIINVDPLPGGNDVVLAAVAIAEKSRADELPAQQAKLLDGAVSNGDLFDTITSDNIYFELKPSATSNPQKQITDVILASQYSGGTPTSFDFILETNMSGGPEGDVIQDVSLWNEASQIWEAVDSRSITNNDGRIQIPASGDLSRFVDPTTGEVFARVTWTSGDFTASPFAWDVAIDQFAWLISDEIV